MLIVPVADGRAAGAVAPSVTVKDLRPELISPVHRGDSHPGPLNSDGGFIF